MCKRIFGSVLVLLLVLVVAVPVAAASNGNGGITGEGLALLIAGLIAPYLTQLLKKWFGGLEARPALWLAFGVSILVSVLALLATGALGWTAPPTEPVAAIGWFAKMAGSVFALATLVYHQFIGNK